MYTLRIDQLSHEDNTIERNLLKAQVNGVELEKFLKTTLDESKMNQINRMLHGSEEVSANEIWQVYELKGVQYRVALKKI
jgi:hypothetical protein